MKRFFALPLLGLAAMACSPAKPGNEPDAGAATTGGTNAGTGSTSSTASSSSSGSSTGSSGGSTGTSGAGTVWQPSKAACASPTIQAGATLTVPQGQHAWGPSLTWGGAEGAVAYSQSPGSNWSLKLQRVDESGQAIGAAVDLGNSQSTYGPRVRIATDGARYIACWDGASSATDGVACAAVPVGSSNAAAGLLVTGATRPSLAHGPAGFVLIYQASGQLMVQPLNQAAQANGAAFAAGGAGDAEIAATPAGYAIGLAQSGPIALVRLDAQGQPVQQGDSFTSASGIGGPLGFAASGELALAVWYDNAMSSMPIFAAVRGNGQPPPQRINPAGSSTYGQVSAAGAVSSFAATWSDFGGTIQYVALDATGALLGSPVTAVASNWDDNPHSLTATGDGFLLAVALSSSMGGGFDSVKLVHLACP